MVGKILKKGTRLSAAKIIAEIILDHLKEYLVEPIDKEQTGSLSGSFCIDRINTFLISVQQCAQIAFPSFIKLEKAFDRINRECVWSVLHKRNMPEKLVVIVKVTYDHAKRHLQNQGKFWRKAE